MRLYELFQKEDKDNVTHVNFQRDKAIKVNPTEPQKAYDAFIGDYLPFNFSNGMELNLMDEDYDPNYTVWVLNDVNGKQIEMGEKADALVNLLQSMTHIPIQQDVANENFADGKKKGKSKPGRVKRSGASCKGSVTSLRAKAKKYSGERGKMYHWCANMKGGKKKKKKTNEGMFDQLPLPTWMSHTSLEKMFRQEYGDQYGDYLAYMDLDSDDDAAMSSDFGDMALDIAKDHDLKEMNKFLSQMPVQFKVDDLRLDKGIQVWHLVQQPTTVH